MQTECVKENIAKVLLNMLSHHVCSRFMNNIAYLVVKLLVSLSEVPPLPSFAVTFQ